MEKDILEYMGIEEKDALPVVLEKIEKALKGRIDEAKLQKILDDVRMHYQSPDQNEQHAFESEKELELDQSELQLEKSLVEDSQPSLEIHQVQSLPRSKKIRSLIATIVQLMGIFVLFAVALGSAASGFDIGFVIILIVVIVLLLLNSLNLFKKSFHPNDFREETVSLYTKLSLPANLLLTYVNLRLLFFSFFMLRFAKVTDLAQAEKMTFRLAQKYLPKIPGWILLIALSLLLFFMTSLVQIYSLVRKKEMLWIKDVKKDA